MKKYIIIILSVVAILFSACGTSSSLLETKPAKIEDILSDENYSPAVSSGAKYSSEYAEEAAYQEEDFISAEDENQKLIYRGHVNVSSEDTSKTFGDVKGVLEEYNAKFESVDVNNENYSLVIRVENTNFTNLFNELQKVSGKVNNSSMSIEDETKNYSDNSRRIESLEEEYDTLLELLKKAETVEETIQIQDRLTYIKYDIDTYKDENSNIDYNVKYSIITMRIDSSKVESVSKESFGKRVKDAFKEGFYGGQEIILILIMLWVPILVTIAIIIIIRKILKHRRAKKKSKE